MNEIKMDEKMLEEICGGNNGQPGMECPFCHTFIPTPVELIAASKSIKCPGCGAVLNCDFPKSRKGMDLLKRMQGK